MAKDVQNERHGRRRSSPVPFLSSRGIRPLENYSPDFSLVAGALWSAMLTVIMKPFVPLNSNG